MRFSVLSTRCHRKGTFNLQVLVYGFLVYCSTRCHTKGATNLQVLIYGFLLYGLQGDTQKVLPIYRFLYAVFQCIVYQVSHKRSYQSRGSYIQIFRVLSTSFHTKGPTNLQVLIYRFLLYCVPGGTQKVLPIYRFQYMGFQFIAYQV